MTVRFQAACVALLFGLLAACSPAESASSPHTTAAATPKDRWAGVLRTLDARRDRAFRRGDGALLRQVYVRGSAPLRADRRLLRAYRQRDLRFDAVRLRLRSVAVLDARPRRVRLRVVDRLAPVRVRTPGGRWQALPRDGPTDRKVLLRRTPDGWRIADLRRLAG